MTDAARRKVVVIGEDDGPIAGLLRDAVNDEPDYLAVVVSDGGFVVETARRVHADLVILDIMMPGLSGLEVYDRLRADPRVRDTPVLFVSAVAAQHESELRARAIRSVLAKPFDLEHLLREVRLLCPPHAPGA